MKKGTKNVMRIIISIIYIVWGIFSPIRALEAVLALSIPDMISAGVGILTLLAGILGLFGMKKIKCRIFAIVILVFAIIGVATALPTVNVDSLVTALLSWLFIICL
jgi:hypothetical protein